MNTPIRAPRPAGCLSYGTLVLVGLALLAGPVAAGPAADAPARGQGTLVTLGQASAEIRFPAPVHYAVLLREPEKIRMVFARGDILHHPMDPARAFTLERVEAETLVLRQGPRGRLQALRVGSIIPGLPGWRFTGTVPLEELHYRYKVVDRILRPDPILLALQGARAILEVEVLRPAPGPPTAPPSPPSTGAGPSLEGPPGPSPSPPERAMLEADLLEKVRVKEIGPGRYEVNPADVQAVLENTGHVLADLEPFVWPTLTRQTGLQYQITSAAGDGVLTGKGFTVTAPKLAARAGIQVGDTILNVNGQPVDGFASLYRIFREVRRDPALQTVQVELERRGTRRTQTYRIR
jgi:hypothetical protein